MQTKFLVFACSIFLCCVSVLSFAQIDNAPAAEANAKLGMAYLKKGFYAVSKERLMSALRDDPNIAVSWYSMAYYLEQTNEKAEAEKYYLKAISVQPKSGSAKNNYGTFLCRVGRYQEGISQFMAAVHERDYLDSAEAYENAAICSLMMHNDMLALQYFHQALDNNPNMPFSLLSVARLDYQDGNDDGARKYFANFKLLSLQGKSDAVIAQYHDYVFGAPRRLLPMPK